MAHKKLRSMVSMAVDPDTGAFIETPRHGKAPTIDIYVETTGKLRLFTLVPEFMAGMISGFERRDVSFEQIQAKKDAPHQWALIARDPDAIDQAWRALCLAYQNEIASLHVEPVITIRHSEGYNGYRNGASGNAAELKVDFDRYLRNTAEPRPRNASDYAWSDDGKPTKKIRAGVDRDWIVVPYTPELWERLCELRDRIRAGQEQYQAMVKSGAIVPRLLAGGGPALLPASLEESGA